MIQKIKEAGNYNRLFQGLAGLISNHRIGVNVVENFRLIGIYKYEGGIKVDKADVVIKYDEFANKIRCCDDRKPKNKKESDLVEGVVTELLNEINWKLQDPIEMQKQIELKYLQELGLTSEQLAGHLSKFTSNPFSGDPLRSLFKES